MLKVVVLLVFGLTFLYSYDGVLVKGGVIEILVNDQSVRLLKDERRKFAKGDIVCYKSGDGKLTITSEGFPGKNLSAKSSPCVVLETEDINSSHISDYVIERIKITSKSEENTISGASRGFDKPKKQRYITFDAKSGMKIVIKDKNGKNIKEMPVYEDDENYMLDTSILKEDLSIEVYGKDNVVLFEYF